MDFGIIIFIIYVVISIVGAINKNKKKFPDRPPEGESSEPSGPTSFEEMIRRAQEAAKKARIEKENAEGNPRTIEATPDQRRPSFEEPQPTRKPVFYEEVLPDRRVLKDEEPYRPNLQPTAEQIEKPRMLERPKIKAKEVSSPTEEYARRKQELKVTNKFYQRIKPPEEDFFQENALGTKAKSQKKTRKQKGIKKAKSSVKKKVLGKEFVFNGKDAIIYSEVMNRRF